MNPNMTPQQQQMLRQQMAQQNPQYQAQAHMRAQQANHHALHRQQMAMAQAQMSYGGMPGAQQHLQPQFVQQRRPSPMGQMQMPQAGQANPMAGFGGMGPPMSGMPMGVGMPPNMHPQQQGFPQQYMQAANPQFANPMNPQQMMSGSPMPPNTPKRPPSQSQMTPSPAPPSDTTQANAMMQNGVSPPGQQPPPGSRGNQFSGQHQQQPPQQQPQPQLQQGARAPPQNSDSTASLSADGKTENVTDQNTNKINILLELNAIMIKCIIELQEKGKAVPGKADGSTGGQQSPTASTPTDASKAVNGVQQSPTQATHPVRPNNHEWYQFMRRLQCNIAYLMGSGGAGAQAKKPLWPPQMDIHPAPPDATIGEATYKQLKELYQRLKETFPEYRPGLNPLTGQPLLVNNQMNANKMAAAVAASSQAQAPSSSQATIEGNGAGV